MTLFEYIDNYIKNYDHVANNETAMIRYCFELKRLIKKYPEFQYIILTNSGKVIQNFK